LPIVLKSGNINLMEPSGPVQACNGIALPLPFIVVQVTVRSKIHLFVRTITETQWSRENWVCMIIGEMVVQLKNRE
jgi:hypothetical protein